MLKKDLILKILGGKIMKEFAAWSAKSLKKTKGTKKCVIKKIKFEDYKNCLK